jgi:hypothetical protein
MVVLESPAVACLERTRAVVLDILVADGIGIAISGSLLRRADIGFLLRAPDIVGQMLLGTLMALAISSYVWRRVWSGRAALRDPARRARRFYLGHVVAAAIGALAVPLGFAYGSLIDPELIGVGPFWVVALALGALALPRASDLTDFDDPMPERSEPKA